MVVLVNSTQSNKSQGDVRMCKPVSWSITIAGLNSICQHDVKWAVCLTAGSSCNQTCASCLQSFLHIFPRELQNMRLWPSSYSSIKTICHDLEDAIKTSRTSPTSNLCSDSRTKCWKQEASTTANLHSSSAQLPQYHILYRTTDWYV